MRMEARTLNLSWKIIISGRSIWEATTNMAHTKLHIWGSFFFIDFLVDAVCATMLGSASSPPTALLPH